MDAYQHNERVEEDHAGDAKKGAPRKVPLRIAQLAGDEARSVPPAVGKNDGSERRTETEPRSRRADVAYRVRWRWRGGGEPKPSSDQDGYGADLKKHEEALSVAPRANAQAVDQCEHKHGRHRDKIIGDCRLSEIVKISRERYRDGRHPAGLNDQQKGPSVEERGQGAVGIAQIGILAADRWPADRELGVDQRAGKSE